VADFPRMRVVSGIIVRNGRALLTQRDPARSSYPWMWESPGGKVEHGESDHGALARELREELGVSAVVWPEELAVIDLDPGGPFHVQGPLRVTLFNVSIGDQHPQPLQSIGIGWFSAAEMMGLQLLPANAAYRHELAERLINEEVRRG